MAVIVRPTKADRAIASIVARNTSQQWKRRLKLSPGAQTFGGSTVEEGQEVIKEFKGAALDAGLLAATQAVEHYERALIGKARGTTVEVHATRGAKTHKIVEVRWLDHHPKM